MNITHFIPCGVDLLYPKAAIGVVRTLEKLGHRVVVPAGPACCGRPAFNNHLTRGGPRQPDSNAPRHRACRRAAVNSWVVSEKSYA